MAHDPIIEEVRRAGDAYMKRFNYDLKAVFADLRRRTEAARRRGGRAKRRRGSAGAGISLAEASPTY